MTAETTVKTPRASIASRAPTTGCDVTRDDVWHEVGKPIWIRTPLGGSGQPSKRMTRQVVIGCIQYVGARCR
jgi:hypothetical protein